MFATDVKSSTLSARLWSPAAAPVWLRSCVLAVAGAALLTLSAKIQVPFQPVPITMQTLVVLLIGAAYGPRLGVATVLLYLGQGMAGLPVFTNTPPLAAGPLYLLGPTGGFLAGFVAAAAIAGVAAERGFDRSIPRLFVALLVADTVLLAAGALWLAAFAWLPNGQTGLGFARAWAVGVAPFLWGELLKIALAAMLLPAAWRLLGRR
jgi:biotin transport system substrate-specific component